MGEKQVIEEGRDTEEKQGMGERQGMEDASAMRRAGRERPAGQSGGTGMAARAGQAGRAELIARAALDAGAGLAERSARGTDARRTERQWRWRLAAAPAAVLALALAFALALASCGGAAGGGSGAGGGNADVAEVEKHNAYIGLYNALISDIDKVALDYVECFGDGEDVYIEEGFSGYTMYSSVLADRLEAAMTYADAKPPAPDADAALRELEPVLARYAAAMADAKKYYEDKNYVDDGYEKAQGYHDVIIGEYELVWEKAAPFLAAVDGLLAGQDDEQLAMYEEAGQMIHYYALASVIAAQAVDSFLGERGIDAAGILEIDADEFRPVYEAFVDAYNGYDALVKEDSGAGEDEGIITLMMFNKELYGLKSSVSELMDRVQTGREFGGTEINIARLTDGTPENIGEITGRLLGAYNSSIAR